MKTLTTLFISATCLTASAQQHMFSDEFDDSMLDPRWGTSNVNIDSHITEGSGTLLLDASPLNGGSDYFDVSNHNAPRILQPVCGNWLVLAKMTVEPFAGDYQDAGFLLFKEDTSIQYNEQRVMMRRWLLNICPPDNQDFRLLDTNLCDFDANTMWMTLEHKGDSIIGQVSADSLTWERRALFDPAVYRYVGLIAVRQPWDNDLAVRTEAYFDYFRFLDMDTLHITSSPDTIEPGDTVELTVDSIVDGSYSWFGPDGAQLSDSSTLVINSADSSDAGWYHVIVSRFDCEFLTDSFLVDFSTAVGEFDLQPTRITIAPNPGRDLITISWTGRKPAHGVLLLRDAMGRVVLRRSLNGDQRATLSVAELPPGAYFVGVQGEQWGSHGKFIKE